MTDSSGLVANTFLCKNWKVKKKKPAFKLSYFIGKNFFIDDGE